MNLPASGTRAIVPINSPARARTCNRPLDFSVFSNDACVIFEFLIDYVNLKRNLLFAANKMNREFDKYIIVRDQATCFIWEDMSCLNSIMESAYRD